MPLFHSHLVITNADPWMSLQIMLTNEPELVSGAAWLLEEVLRDNKPALAILYQTGVFYFALAYCGSNFAEIARLFHVSSCAPEHETWAS